MLDPEDTAWSSKGTQLGKNNIRRTSGFAEIHVPSSVRSFASSKRETITSNIRIRIGLLRLSDLHLRPHAMETCSLKKIRAGLDSWSS